MSNLLEKDPFMGPDKFFIDICQFFSSNIADTSISIPENKGSGMIWINYAARGLNGIFFDMQLKDGEEFFRAPIASSAGLAFTFICILTPEHLQIRTSADEQPLFNIILTSSSRELRLKVTPQRRVKAVMINVTEEWLMNAFKSAGVDLLLLLHEMSEGEKSLLFSEQASFSLLHTMSEMHEYSGKHPSDQFYMNTKVLPVLYDVLNSFLVWSHGMVKGETVVLNSKMIAVENLLNNYLDKNLPGIKSIAKELALSESTLKRNFKQVFGISIYEYYLQKKMQYARQLLDEKSFAVKEVAYMLGYQKASNFIKIFRKHYDASPGEFRKKHHE